MSKQTRGLLSRISTSFIIKAVRIDLQGHVRARRTSALTNNSAKSYFLSHGSPEKIKKEEKITRDCLKDCGSAFSLFCSIVDFERWN
jgi:hypothetical protein